MKSKRIVAWTLAAALIAGTIAPAEAVRASEIEAAGWQESTEAEQTKEPEQGEIVLAEVQREQKQEEAATSDFTIEEGVLTGYTGEGGAVTIPSGVTSIGDEAFMNCTSLTSVTIPSGVTSIGDQAFFVCTSLTSVTIPSGVTSIGERAFANCTSLTSVTIPSGVTSIGDEAFSACTSLTSVTIPSGVTRIGDQAFESCTSLTSVTIPSGVTSIGSGAFWGCNVLTEVSIPDSVKSIGGLAFSYTALERVTIPKGVTSIEAETFNGCSSLIEVSIPDSVKSIGTAAFNGTVLERVSLPEGVEHIGARAFQGCGYLKEISIPASVKSIGGLAFYSCGRLAGVRIPDGVKTIGVQAFSNCSPYLVILCSEGSAAAQYAEKAGIRHSNAEKAQQRIYASDVSIDREMWINKIEPVLDGNGTLSYASDNEAVVMVDANGRLTPVKEGFAHITITASETSTHYAAEKVIEVQIFNDDISTGYEFIAANNTYKVTKQGKEVAYTGVYKLRSAEAKIPATVKYQGITYKVTSIDSGAFFDMSRIRRVTIGNNVKTIGREAFSGCTNLTSVTLGEGVTKIGREAFYDCTNLGTVKINSAKLNSVGKNAFKGIKKNAVIKVPKKQLKAYKKILKGKGLSSKAKITK